MRIVGDNTFAVVKLLVVFDVVAVGAREKRGHFGDGC